MGQLLCTRLGAQGHTGLPSGEGLRQLVPGRTLLTAGCKGEPEGGQEARPHSRGSHPRKREAAAGADTLRP